MSNILSVPDTTEHPPVRWQARRLSLRFGGELASLAVLALALGCVAATAPVLGIPAALAISGLLASALLVLRAVAKHRVRARARVRVDRRAADAARADERAKLAREMHDVVSHQVTLIAMQAGALQVAEDADRIQIATTIRELATTTLTELRGLLSALRPAQDKTLDQVIELAERHGAEVQLDVELAAATVSGPVANAAYRTVQEALTNAHKHAPGAGVLVSVTGEGAELAVTVTNTAPQLAPQAIPSPRLPSGGHGLTGLRERAAGIGGRFTAEPTATGGFAVSARYPLAS